MYAETSRSEIFHDPDNGPNNGMAKSDWITAKRITGSDIPLIPGMHQ